MKYLISAIGKMKTSPEAKIFNEYSKRIKDLTLLEHVSRFPKGKKRISDETEKLFSISNKNDKNVLLDQSGKILSSDEFSLVLSKWKNEGIYRVNFFIGGAEGVEEKLKNNVDLVLSFSKMIFPHMLSRIMLIEQIYRAEAIISKHPYHRS